MPHCPSGCCCPRPGFFVLCESLGLRSLPRFVPLSTSALSVARNQLCNVDHLLGPFSGLQELSLSHNLLARFPRGLPPSLESLLLQENLITYITSGVLRQLGNLTRLDLEHNRLRAIQPGAFQSLARLQVLILKGNDLTSLPPNLPPSLTHLDLSANCISALDPPSLSALVNLQVLKMNSNCLRSVPESAFDGLARLRSVDLTNNLWACKCDILNLHRWPLRGGGLSTAADPVCNEPTHLAHRLLLNLSVTSICPHAPKPNEEHVSRTKSLNSNFQAQPETPTAKTTGESPAENKRFQSTPTPREGTAELLSRDRPETRVLLGRYFLESLTFKDCLSQRTTPSVSPPHSKPTTYPPNKEQKCRDNITGQFPRANSTAAEGTRSLISTNREALWPTPDPPPRSQRDSGAVVIALLAVLCVLVALLTLAVLLLLKKVLLRQQRVAPLDVGSGG
ncbi:leucine-rich repeat-containing protein 24-like [Brachionichthys hirsutus]|uniref:leucine-rich repeat-containing protein 24-like n=1 Tax=Brachionichthys hirsutus TaxID=412623 RepID=UPI0036045967